MPGSASPQSIQLAEESFHRCQGEAFLQRIYHNLLASDPRIPPLFEKTDFARQTKLLQHSIGVLFIYAKRPNPALLERIARRHAPGDLNVPPDMYPCFADSLVAAVRAFDPKVSPEVEQAWREAITPGINFMISMYTGDGA